MSQEALASGGHHDLSYVASTPVVNRSTYDQHNSDPGRLDHLLNVRGGLVSVKRNVRTPQVSCFQPSIECVVYLEIFRPVIRVASLSASAMG